MTTSTIFHKICTVKNVIIDFHIFLFLFFILLLGIISNVF